MVSESIGEFDMFDLLPVVVEQRGTGRNKARGRLSFSALLRSFY